MDAALPVPQVRFLRLLPYWAVLRTDLRTVVRSWAYWLWVSLFVAISAGHIIYRYALVKSGFTAAEDSTPLTAAAQTSKIIQVILSASLAVVAFLSVSSISSERNTVADAVLSRGISRRAYFMAKWHARLVAVLGTFMLLSLGVLLVYCLLLGDGSVVEKLTVTNPDGTTAIKERVVFQGLSSVGSVLGVAMVAAGLAVVVSGGVTIGAISNSTLFAITISWVALYGGLSLMTLLPEGYPTPGVVLGRLTQIMQGQYDTQLVGRVLGYSAIASLVLAGIGLVVFDRKDV
jgi:ABC-type transport system involved in multi-copper enzyme maturation permease subunit